MTSHELLIDKRIVQRNIEQGKLEPAEYQRLLNALPDLSDKVWRRPAAVDLTVSSASSASVPPPAPQANAPESELPPASTQRSDLGDAAGLLDSALAVQPQPTSL